MAKRSDQEIALGWRSAWVCRINRLGIASEVLENPLNHCGFLDTGDHPQLPATPPAGLDVNSGKRSDAERTPA
jgi:hypothetical protein